MLEEQDTKESLIICRDALPGGQSIMSKFCYYFVSCGESFVDVMEWNCWTYTLVVWIILVVVDGAIFFMLLVRMIVLDTEELQQTWLNNTIQLLCALFTYTALLNLPPRIRRLVRLYGDRCKNIGKREIRGISASTDIFDYISWQRRHFIIQNLVWNCLFQLVNQVTRIVYWSVELATTFPGTLWVNLFFALSMICAFIAALCQALSARTLRKNDQGPVDEVEDAVILFLKNFWKKLWGVQSEGIKLAAHHRAVKHHEVTDHPSGAQLEQEDEAVFMIYDGRDSAQSTSVQSPTKGHLISME